MAYENVDVNGEQFNFEEAGDTLEGNLVELSDQIDGEFGPYRFLTVENDDGVWKIIVSGILESKVLKSDANVGDLLLIKFEGLKKSKTNPSRSYKNWTVMIDRQSPKTDWDSKEAF